MKNHFQITSSQIADWAKTKEAQTALPRLIRRLIHTTVNPSNCDFPAGDSTSSPGCHESTDNIPGRDVIRGLPYGAFIVRGVDTHRHGCWDGELCSSLKTPWTPAGQSYWELSCEDKPTGKANRDYSKRTKQTDELIRSKSTLVLVTARKWSQKKQWQKKKLEAREWMAIRIFDADDIEQWLEQCPAVALQFAEELGISGPEVESISKYWETWSSQAQPAITAESFHTSREHSRVRLISDIRKKLESVQPGICSVKADSVEEAVAFVCSALLTQVDLASSSLVVTDVAGWRYVDKHDSLQIAIAARPEIAERPSSRAGLVLVIPYAAGDMGGYFQGFAKREDDAGLTVERPDIYKFDKTLTAMGLSEGEAHRIAANTGRSWSVYRRRFAKNLAICRPAWLAAPQAASLSTMCLLGAWSGDNEVDKEFVSFLADRAYEDVEKELRYLSRLDDAPVLAIGPVWKAKSALELLVLFGDSITSNELVRFFKMAHKILTESNPELELPDEKPYAVQNYGKVRPQSGLLIETLCDALVKLAVVGIQIPALADAHIESRVARLVSELLDKAGGTRWLSLSSLLPALAEAAPDTFLKAIEKSLIQADAPVSRLITETGSSSAMGRCWHSGLLWALETLAWSPNQFTRVMLILARLVRVPYRNNWGNTPMASLVSLLRSWYPQTAANIQQRIAALDMLITKEQDIAFDLLDRLLNVGPDCATPAQRPKWRNDDAGFGHGVTVEEQMKMLVAVADRLITLAEQQPQRIVRLIDKLFFFDTDYIDKTLSLIAPYTESSASDEDREAIRAALRKKIHQYRNNGNRGKPLKIDIDTIEKLYRKLEPNGLLIRHRWLFANGWMQDVPWRVSDDYSKRGEQAETLRLDALRKIHTTLGMAGVESLALSCGAPHLVGLNINKLNMTNAELVSWIAEKGGDFSAGNPLVNAISGLFYSLEVTQSLELISSVIDKGSREHWGAEKIARLMMLAPQCVATWDKIATFGAEIEKAFWSAVQPHFLMCEDTDSLFLVINRLLQVGRSRSAFQCCEDKFNRVGADLVAEMLERILRGEEPNGLLDSWHIDNALEHLRASQAIDKARLMRLEFGFVPAMGYGAEQRAETLYEAVMSEPAFFTELLCILYKPKHGEKEKLPTEAEQSIVDAAYRLLRACRRQPGTQPDGSIDPVAFVQFIDNVRELCQNDDRLEVCDSKLGQILAHAPPDADGLWPCLATRDMLDRPELEGMRRGFQIGVQNKRGMTSRNPCEGGDQERKLADHYRHLGQALAFSHVNLAATFEELARWYESDGQREDLGAKLQRETY